MTGAFHRFAVGSFECTSLSDGENDYNLAQMFANVSEEEVRKLLRAKHLRDDLIVTPYSNLHIDTGDWQLLVDAGAGKLSKTTGRLLESMASAEIDPAAVDTIIVTHAHPERAGELLAADLTPCFPNAEYIIAQREWDFWFSGAERGREQSKVPKFFFDLAEERTELYPGVFVRAAFGHTPGHMVTELSSRGESLLRISEAVLTPLHLERPAWLPVFDIIPPEAAVTVPGSGNRSPRSFIA